MSEDQYSIERIADRMKIQDTIYRWCRGIDRLDYAAIRSAFHPDAVDEHGMYVGGVDGLVSWIDGRHQGISRSMHLVGNILIEFGDADTAIAESYCVAIQRYEPEGGAGLSALSGGARGKEGQSTDLVGVCRYVDRFERRAGEWCIARRSVVFDSVLMLEVGPNAPKMSAEWIVGQRRDQTDFIYGALAKAGIS